jgi:hypothetical protein
LGVAGGPLWQFHGSLIDATRNRWVYCEGGALQFIDLTTNIYSKVTVTGDANFAFDAGNSYSTLLHDLDNDRYLLFIGDSNASPPVPGRVYAINPTTAVATLIATIPAAFNGVNNRASYFQSLGGVAYLSDYSSNVLFMPTR